MLRCIVVIGFISCFASVAAARDKCCIKATASADIHIHPTIRITNAATGAETYSYTSTTASLNFLLDLTTCSPYDTSSTDVSNPDEGDNRNVNSWIDFPGQLVLTLQSGARADRWIGVLYVSKWMSIEPFDPPNTIYQSYSSVHFCVAGNPGGKKLTITELYEEV